jgi:hypothetical protein
VYFSKFMSQLPRPMAAPVHSGSPKATHPAPYVGAFIASVKTQLD